MGASADQEAASLDALFGIATSYLRLCRYAGASPATAPGLRPNKDGSLPSGLVEVSAGGYTPIAVPEASWDDAVPGDWGPTEKALPHAGVSPVGWTPNADITLVTCYVFTSDANPITRANFLWAGCFVDANLLDENGQPTPITQDLPAGRFFGWDDAVPLRVHQGGLQPGVNPLEGQTPPTPPAQKNVVVIMHDDGNQWEASPLYLREKFNRLITAEGVTCTSFIAPIAICGPCRHTYMSGQLSQTNNVTNSQSQYGGFPAASTSGFSAPLLTDIDGRRTTGTAYGEFNYTDYLPTWLWGTALDRLHQTMHVGKFVNGWENANSEKGCWPKFVPPGFDRFYAPCIGMENKDNFQVWEQINNLDGTPASQFLYPAGAGNATLSPNSVHIHDYMAEKTVLGIRDFAANKQNPAHAMHGKGFFVEVWPNAPHTPQEPYPDGSNDNNYTNIKGVVYPDALWGDRFPNAPVIKVLSASRSSNVVTLTFDSKYTIPVHAARSGSPLVTALLKDFGDATTDTFGLSLNGGPFNLITSGAGFITIANNGANGTATKLGWLCDSELTERNLRVRAYNRASEGGTWYPPLYDRTIDVTVQESWIDGVNCPVVDVTDTNNMEGANGINQIIARQKSYVSVDDLIGSVRDELEACGELENTIIMVFTDNGFNLGEHGVWGSKGDPTDCNLVLAAAIIGPDIPKPQAPATRLLNDAPMSIVQLAATVCEILGVTPPALRNVGDPPTGAGTNLIALEGQSFMPAITDPHYFDALTYQGQGQSSEHVSRTRDWKYWGTGPDAGTNPNLYFLPDDPWESVNLAGNPAFATIQEAMRARAVLLANCHGNACLVAAP